jgi:small conductance mechanosensitive channel
MTKSGTDETLIIFTKDLLIFVGYIFVIVAALNKLGVNTASAIAVIGAAGLAIGLAFQGALANFAAGCLIIIFRPFKVGDLIQAGGELGKVREIELFTTKMVTPDNKTVIVPNAQLTADKIINFTETDEIRLDLVFGVSYAADIDHVKKVIAQVLDSDKRILKNPAYFIGVKAHADSSVNFAVRPWVKADEYWNVFFSLQEEMKKAFDKENIEIPFPQRDVHIKND